MATRRISISGLSTSQFAFVLTPLRFTAWLTTNKKCDLLGLILLLFGLGVALFVGCGKEASPLLIQCGSSMSTPLQEIGKRFTQKSGVPVEYNFGGSETLLPQIELTRQGDLFVTHDPYPGMLAEKGLLEEAVTVGYLAPVLITAKGNPKGIRSLEDLARPGIRVALGDPRFQTCAQMVHERLKERGIEAAVMKNVVLESRGHQELGNAVKLGTADAAVVWNFIAVLNADALDAVWTEDVYPEIRVQICLLKSSKQQEKARQFLRFATTDSNLKIFEDYGYRR